MKYIVPTHLIEIFNEEIVAYYASHQSDFIATIEAKLQDAVKHKDNSSLCLVDLFELLDRLTILTLFNEEEANILNGKLCSVLLDEFDPFIRDKLDTYRAMPQDRPSLLSQDLVQDFFVENRLSMSDYLDMSDRLDVSDGLDAYKTISQDHSSLLSKGSAENPFNQQDCSKTIVLHFEGCIRSEVFYKHTSNSLFFTDFGGIYQRAYPISKEATLKDLLEIAKKLSNAYKGQPNMFLKIQFFENNYHSIEEAVVSQRLKSEGRIKQNRQVIK